MRRLLRRSRTRTLRPPANGWSAISTTSARATKCRASTSTARWKRRPRKNDKPRAPDRESEWPRTSLRSEFIVLFCSALAAPFLENMSEFGFVLPKLLLCPGLYSFTAPARAQHHHAAALPHLARPSRIERADREFTPRERTALVAIHGRQARSKIEQDG